MKQNKLQIRPHNPCSRLKPQFCRLDQVNGALRRYFAYCIQSLMNERTSVVNAKSILASRVPSLKGGALFQSIFSICNMFCEGENCPFSPFLTSPLHIVLQLPKSIFASETELLSLRSDFHKMLSFHGVDESPFPV